MTTTPILPLNASTFAAAFAAIEYNDALRSPDAFLHDLAASNDDYESLAELALDDCRDNIADNFAPLFFSIDALAELDDDFDLDELFLDLLLDPHYEILHTAITNAYRSAHNYLKLINHIRRELDL